MTEKIRKHIRKRGKVKKGIWTREKVNWNVDFFRSAGGVDENGPKGPKG